MYLKSLKETNGAKRSYEAHFNNVSKEAATLGTKEEDPEIPRMTNNEDRYGEHNCRIQFE
jgi:hypothetical protein